ncbi:Ger(x)C family spore germination protein [Acetivibrio straminisolvens]|jgi:spore germination protein KC|uniref:Spore germination protein GerKC n=1 Tax=Acetivibrio straminisolvens JCM 21531 TaxID=1294263 RepID=W4V7Y1_9FIRM|nr:Ger(x)C family spore germination protein [Acetivibrio straminisolvens]GAE89337.1 spore germination protein GerKC [Acetivibrio straminisolvens JCM 21531]
MGSKTKRTLIVLISFIMCLSMTGCFDKREVDDLVNPIAIGFDKGQGRSIKMTLQIAIPTKVAGGGEGGGGGGGKESVSYTTVEAPSIYSGLNMINSYVSKQLNMSQIKVLVFSEELAREGVEKYINALMRGREFRPNSYVLVARGSGNAAERYLRAVEPELESNPAKYYEMVLSAYSYTGFSANTSLMNFYKNMVNEASQPLAVLADISKFEKSDDINTDNSTYREKGRDLPLEGDFKAGDMPKVGTTKSEIMGLAVFNGSKMVGEFDGEETQLQLMLEGDFGYSYVTIPDPLVEDYVVLLNIKQNRNPNRSVEIVNGKPNIKVKVFLEADILSIQSGINYESLEMVNILETYAEDFFKKGITRMLEKTARELKTDTAGFGKEMKGKFLTWDEWIDFNWIEKYPDSKFEINVDLKIRRPGLMLRSNPATGIEVGEE